MITLTNSPSDVHGAQYAPTLAPGTVYVVDANGAKEVSEGQKVVLEVGGEKKELTTASPSGTFGGPAFYLNPADFAGVTPGALATMRLHRFRDTSRKIFSRAGFLVWAPLVIGLVLAGLGLWFLAGAKDPISAGTIVDRAKLVQAWAGTSAARQPVAVQCLDGLAGRDVKEVTQIPDVKCKPAQLHFWEDKDNEAIFTTIAGVLTAILGFVASMTKFKFGSKP